jgi:hypothetical protein
MPVGVGVGVAVGVGVGVGEMSGVGVGVGLSFTILRGEITQPAITRRRKQVATRMPA